MSTSENTVRTTADQQQAEAAAMTSSSVAKLAQLLNGDARRAERMVRLAAMAIQKTPALAQVAKEKLFLATLQVAQLGLDIGPMGAWMVPYKGDITVIVSPQGLIDLMMRSGFVKDVEARVVREHDEFDIEYGSGKRVVHKPNLKLAPTKNAPIGAYTVITLMTGGQIVEYMTQEEIEAIRGRSPSWTGRNGPSGPWVTDALEMWRKTVLKRAAKYAPKSVELRDAIELDNREFEQAEIAAQEVAALPAGTGASATLARLQSKGPPALPHPPTTPVPARKPGVAMFAATARPEPTDGEARQVAQESEMSDVVRAIHGMLREIRLHAEKSTITWPQARKIARVLHERWPSYESEPGQVREAYIYLAGRHGAVLRIAAGTPAGGTEESAAA